ncbi:formylglycine-generating enzyme family protein [Rhizobium johnstonii]|uniref:formylglycine-generating enzyme family protein n=1 Tax=Rhizobium johnstonii TaxID=3019933 RepID=UPI002DDDBB4F|nr:SUMF1/EgtB/PvdO family nonheme iron enzyme [Rhizobium johnstonii]
MSDILLTVRALTASFRAIVDAASPDMPELVQKHIHALRAHVAQRDHADVGRSWPLETRNGDLPWFERMPIEVTPRAFVEAPSKEVLALVEAVDGWADEDGPDHNAIFAGIFSDWQFNTAAPADRTFAQWMAFALLTVDLTRPWRRDGIYTKLAPAHGDPVVRSLALSLAYVDLPWVPAEQYVYACTHDTDEPVFIKAFRVCGRRHDERAFDHLRPIVQSPAAVLRELDHGRMYYPVGHAACSICPAQFAILGTDIPEIAQERQSQLMSRIRRPLSVPVEHARDRLKAAIEAFQQPPAPAKKPNNLDQMIEIPAGEFIAGVDPHEIVSETFDWSKCTPRRSIHLDTFFIDKYPITTSQYDAWVEAFEKLPAQRKRSFDHPGQPRNKSHRRNTVDDPRFAANHPVVGIDWFDAWAYARFHGKSLPTEWQWEKAARGTDGRWYPWGNMFDPTAVRYAGETYGREMVDLTDWVAQLSQGYAHFPQTTTAPVDAHPEGNSPYGVADMCGNSWEFTTTCFFTGETVRAAFADFTPIELMGSREGHVVIRGGAWSSPHPLIGAAYRGFDLLTDRHTEIGFRCVWEQESSDEKQGGKKDV